MYQIKAADYTSKLCAGLQANTHLTELKLGKCGINDECAKALAATLATSSTLVSISLNANRIHDDGCIALARAMGSNATLREINIFGQKVSNQCHSATITGRKTRRGLMFICSLSGW